MKASLDSLRAAGALSPLDGHFARTLGAMLAEPREPVLVAAALASRYVGAGHVCLDLSHLLARGLPQTTDAVEPGLLPDLDAWLEALRASPLVEAVGIEAGSPADFAAATPLVLDAAGRLYLRRMWDLQQRLAARLRERAREPVGELDEAVLRAGLERLFDARDGDSEAPDRQREAAARALSQRLCVIAGGPGTGKTATVAQILVLVAEQRIARAAPPPRILLVAPTGKAAARLAESLREALARIAPDETVRAMLSTEATTIHRCLGRAPGGRMRYHADDPLPADLLLVDEASMVDLALMTRLVEACPPAARLILLGDSDQLASVEAGAVLGDICDLRTDDAPVEASASEGPLSHCLVRLTRSYRYAADSGIAALAAAVRSGDVEAALNVLDDPAREDVALVDHAAGLSRALRSDVDAGYADFLAAAAPAEKLAAFDAFRVLCAHRQGPDGAEALNAAIETALARSGGLAPMPGDYPGRPILVTRNDYDLGIFNGDVGVIERGPDGGLRAHFRAEGGALRWVSPLRLAAHETVFAMSVHKSQGSEFDRVAVVLPKAVSAILSRELIYTAVSRARQSVRIHADRAVFAEAIQRRVERASGLRDLLWR